MTIVELGKDGVTLVAEGGHSVLDIGDAPLRNDIWDSPSEGHSTGGEDSEDGKETHGGEVEKVVWAERRSCLG